MASSMGRMGDWIEMAEVEETWRDVFEMLDSVGTRPPGRRFQPEKRDQSHHLPARHVEL